MLRNSARAILVASALSLAVGAIALAEPPAFERGVALYKDGKFAEAEAAFKESPHPSSTVLYNTGNACFKQGKLGEAILCWERGLKLDPRDRDCAGNLEMASQLLRDAVPPDETPLPLQWASAALLRWPLSYLRAAASWLWVIANIALFVLIVMRRASRPVKLAAVGLLVASLLVAAVLGVALYREKTTKYGVLVVAKESVRSGPGAQNTVLMEIHEGLKVRILNSEGEWVAVKIAGGYSGWLPLASIGII